MRTTMSKNTLGLFLFFLPEFVLLIIWILFRSSIIDIRTATFSQSIETGSIRLITISVVLLAITQVLRIFALQTAGDNYWNEKKTNISGLIVILFIILGIASELPNIESVMSESYASMIMFFVAMTGAIYLFCEIFISLIAWTLLFIKGR